MSSSASGQELPFTFGVELEFIFAIRKDQVYDSDNRRKYRRGVGQGWIAPRLQDIMRDRDAPVLVSGINSVVEYREWYLDYENGVRLEDKKGETLSSTFPDDSRLNATSDDYWEKEGLELVSLVMNIPDLVARGSGNDPSLAEIRKYLEALVPDRGDAWFARTTKKCGVHVHIGLPKDSDDQPTQMPLRVLQHLSYILLEYEDVISFLHHPLRRGFYDSDHDYKETSVYIGTNKLGINGHEHVCNQFTKPQDPYIRDKIFHDDMDTETLAELMSYQADPKRQDEENQRYKFVNFEHVRRYEAGATRPPTVEYRQHDGTLNFNDVAHWVRFLTALMRVAEKRANEGTPTSPSLPYISRSELTFAQREDRKYRFRCKNFQSRLEELFDLLGLDRIQQQYWVGKLREYNAHEFIRKPYTQLCKSCRAKDELTDPEQYLRFCRELEIIDKGIDDERRTSGRSNEKWTEKEEEEEREKRVEAAARDIAEGGGGEGSGLHDPGAIRTEKAGGGRPGPYDRKTDPQVKTRAARRERESGNSAGSNGQGDFRLGDAPKGSRRSRGPE